MIGFGAVEDDRPTLGTAFLNFGTRWVSTPFDGTNQLRDGAVSDVVNNTGPDVEF
jgi:hypothetical protein